MSWFSKNPDVSAPDPGKAARTTSALVSLPFAAMGLIAFMMLVHDGVMGELNRATAIKLGSVIIVSAGFIVLIFGIVAKKTSLGEQLKASLAENPEKPWLQRPDWSAGRIKSSGIPDAKAYLTMGIVFCVLGVIIACLMVPMAIHTKNYSDLVGLFFPMVGIIFLTSVVRKIRANRRFGDCIFEMASVPASLGGSLQGNIRTALPLISGQKMTLEISCIQRTVSGVGQHRRANEKILWNEQKVLKVPAPPSSGGGTIPVLFDIPPNQPQSRLTGGETINWRLEAKMPQVNFHATFDVPVFKITDVSTANKPADPA